MRQLESVVANHPSGFFDLAAAPRQPLDAMPTSPRKTRVGGFRRHASGRLSSRGLCRSINTPGSRACGYKTVSGRHEWLNRDPLAEGGGLNLYAYVGNNPINNIDPLGLFSWSGLGVGLLTVAIVAGVIATGGSILIVGAVAGAGINEAAQLYQNGGNWGQVNTTQVAIGGLTGAAGAGIGAAFSGLSAGAQIGLNAAAGGGLSALGKAAEGDGGNCPDNFFNGVENAFVAGTILGGVSTGAGLGLQNLIEDSGSVGSFGELSLGQQLQMSGALTGNFSSYAGLAQGVGLGVSSVIGAAPTP